MLMEWLLAALIFVINLADIHSTYLFSKKYGRHEEANPLILWLWNKIGFKKTAVLKMMVVLVAIWCLWPIKWQLVIAVIYCALIVVNNYLGIILVKVKNGT